MSTYNCFLVVALAFGIMCNAVPAQTPNLGRDVMPEEIASWDISVGPDGEGLPSGSGTPQQG